MLHWRWQIRIQAGTVNFSNRCALSRNPALAWTGCEKTRVGL